MYFQRLILVVDSVAPGARKDEENKTPTHRIGEPNEIGKVAFLLASDAASYITGTTIYVDGGLTLVT
jgi:glucose 1-dehydrogenase